MGNNPSRATTPTSNPQSPASASASHGPATIHNAAQPARSVGPRRRESIQALSHSQGNVKATAAPPSASLESAAAHSSTVRPHSRGRSQTVAAAAAATTVASQLRAHDISFRDRPASEESMGNEQSRQKAHRESTPPRSSQQQSKQPALSSPHTKPVDVPALAKDESNHGHRIEPSSIEPAASSQDEYYIPPSQYSRPPRLPLPIEEEVHTPGSPIISPADLASPLDPSDVDGVLPRRTSVLSSTTVDEDDVGDDFHTPETGAQPAVPTIIEWTQPGEKVYVTGTFAGNWDRKYRLHRKYVRQSVMRFLSFA